MGKKKKNISAFNAIAENYLYLNTMIINEMEIMSTHGGITGNFREKSWLAFFRSIVPQKYSLAQGVKIIDSHGGESKEVDIAVFDEQYTPYVFQYRTVKFIPIEAVSLVISCKSKKMNMKELKGWSESIDSLHTSRAGISRIITGLSTGYTNEAQTRTRPIKILMATKEYVRDQSAEEFAEELQDHYDFVILEKAKKKGSFKIFELTLSHSERTLGDWYRELNQVPKEKGKKHQEKAGAEATLADGKTESAEAASPEAATAKSVTPQPKDISVREETWKKVEEAVQADNLLDIVKGEVSQGNQHLSIKNTLKELTIENNPLLTLNLQLNQLLMLINNPMLFPHYAYAAQFKKVNKGGENDNE